MPTVKQSVSYGPQLNPNTGPTGAVCIPNISTAERRKRLAFGVVTLVVTLVILAVLMATGVSRWWRLPLFLLFMGAATGYFQWRDKT